MCARIAIVLLVGLLNYSISQTIRDGYSNAGQQEQFILSQIRLDPMNIRAWIWNSGVFDQDLRTPNTPGFEWPAGTGKFAIFTAGLNIAALVNNSIRTAMAFYQGEYTPGYIIDSSGPVVKTDARFKFYKVTRGDNIYNNPDWLNWGLMVPFGAPFADVNHNGIYEPAIDTPGIRGAKQTIFICLTDGFSQTHSGSGLCGGTPPLFAEVHMTAWGFDNPGLEDVQFLKWDIVNKNNLPWNSTYIGIACDPDLGDANDDCLAFDTSGRLAICYNSDNQDGTGGGITYGASPPAVGLKWLKCYPNSLDLNSFVPILGTNVPGACFAFNPCYNLLRGFKNDGSWWLNPKVTQGTRKTKFVFSGGVFGFGWNEGDGIIDNCGGDTVGNIVHPQYGDRRFIMAAGSDNLTINPGESKTIMIAQLIARGSDNKNSVTQLMWLSNEIQTLCDNGFIINVKNISTSVPGSFRLYQNYPNPFNPVTKIKFDISTASSSPVKLAIYDVLGKEIAVLVNESAAGGLNPGTYETDWDASNFPSGVYFYKLVTDNYTVTKKMVLIK
jgi:hypothetical protein